jgi:hypothetical protein
MYGDWIYCSLRSRATSAKISFARRSSPSASCATLSGCAVRVPASHAMIAARLRFASSAIKVRGNPLSSITSRTTVWIFAGSAKRKRSQN